MIWNLTSFDVFSVVNINKDLYVVHVLERRYFKQFVVSFKKIQNYVLFYQKQEPAPGRKFPEPEPPPKQAGSETL